MTIDFSNSYLKITNKAQRTLAYFANRLVDYFERRLIFINKSATVSRFQCCFDHFIHFIVWKTRLLNVKTCIINFERKIVIDFENHSPYFIKQVFLKVLLNSQGNTCPRVPYSIKLQDWSPTFRKKDSSASVFLLLKILLNSKENTQAGAPFLIKLQACPVTFRKNTPAQVYFCEFCDIFNSN